MNSKNRRIARESQTMRIMVGMYCRDVHHQKTLCPECAALMTYADERLVKCPFQEGTPTCAKCKVHCYRIEKREQVRTVMRYSGPRMLLHHPVLAIFHLMDGKKKEPVKKAD